MCTLPPRGEGVAERDHQVDHEDDGPRGRHLGLHAVVDGLTVHVLAGHLTADQMVGELDAFLAGL
ncbi:hypothetical protein [Actinoplanes sp. NPDC020271]|uniref:hypothetical protein n=1 Tax=Actinoplanes sp. NPDC020271 TaxID=3363896 RepID=UPI0037ABE5E7